MSDTNPINHSKEPDNGLLHIDFEKYTLENGLQVVLHPNTSNPIVAIAILYHVGSSREKPGKTGFAHFFEHMLFQNSENVGKGEFFRKIDDLGGTFNGGTWNDGTVYYEVVPKDALEKMLWMESDRMGFLINTVTQGALEREKDIVINEKRQRADNQPYGHTGYVIDQALYPEGHPYSWQVIGSMDDVRAASLDDVREFYDKYYGVNNATMVIAGDFEPEKVKELIQKYFGEFRPRAKPEPITPEFIQLAKRKRFYHEDNFARLPELNLVFPTVEVYHPDTYALEILGDLLADGKKAPLYKEIVENRKLAPQIAVFNQSMELAGKFNFNVRAFEGVCLDDVYDAISDGLRNFERDGFSESDLQRLKNLHETSFYNSISSLLGKSFQLVQASVFGGDPSRMTDDMHKLQAVTSEDVMRVYKKYVKSANYVATSFVPKGQIELALTHSEKASVVEEQIEEAAADSDTDEVMEETFDYTPSTFDRSIEPPLGEKPLLKSSEVFSAEMDNGLKVYGLQNSSLPLIQFSIRMKGGQLLDSLAKPGIARMVAEMMQEGTRNRTPEALEEAIGQLGATINVNASYEHMTFTVNCLARNYDAVLALVQEMLLEPRWDEQEFARIKQSTISAIVQRKANPNAVAGNVFYRKLFGDQHILGQPITGTVESVGSIELDDLKKYYQQFFSPKVASFHFAGDLYPEKAVQSLRQLEVKWYGTDIDFPDYLLPEKRENPSLFFVDVPDAKQSVIMIGSLAMARNHNDFAPAALVNYKLGDGSGSRLFGVLRLEKGYTYGAYSFFMPRSSEGIFIASASVQSAFTLESLKLFREILGSYGNEFNTDQLDLTRSAIIRANAGKLETINSQLEMLHEISTFGLPADYVKKEEAIAEKISLDEAKAIYGNYIQPEQMIYVVVGDARTQFDRLKDAGLGQAVLVDVNGDEVK